MQNLPKHLRQKDKRAYEAISPGGSEHYEMLYMSGRATREGKPDYMGIPADDFNIFATMVYAMADHASVFARVRSSGAPVRHIDVGTGPNLYVFIASLPYADEMISVDISPANVKRMEAIARGVLPRHWHAWLDLATIVYDVGDAQSLARLDARRSDLYDQLRHWPTLSVRRRAQARAEIYELLDITTKEANPYRDIDISSSFSQKLRPRVGDVLDGVAQLRSLKATADIYTHVFFSESIDNTLEVVLHAETNGIQFAKEGALSISGHMSKTMGYKGFYTPDELDKDAAKILVELPATPGFFEAVLGELVDLTDEYRVLWAGLVDSPEERKMVRQGLLYGGAVIVCGTARYMKDSKSAKYANGVELLSGLTDILRTVTVDDQTFHCASWEVGNLVNELSVPLKDKSTISFAIGVPRFSESL